MQQIDVSIVVCTYNRANMLRGALNSLVALETEDRFDYEVVVVDNASSDETPEVIAEVARSAPVPIRGVRELRPGVACARNRGVREARGEWIAFFDDDQLAHPQWIVELLAMAGRKEARCVGGAVHLDLSEDEVNRLAPTCRTLLGEAGHRSPRRYDRKFNPGCGNLMLHRSVFDEVGHFDESLESAGEDTDLFHRIRAAGIESWYTPQAIVSHLVPPERLQEDSLRRTSLRIGGHLARRERAEWGRFLFPWLLPARLGQAVVLYLPRWWTARVRGDADAALGARCRIWLAMGYLRGGLSLMAPRLLAQEAFFSRLQFRSERQRSNT